VPKPKAIPIGGKNLLFYGDNLPVLREHLPDECVDLIYLDPPFNSNRSYSVLFKSASGDESQAQIEAFDDSWHWSQQAEHQFVELVGGGAPGEVADAISAMRRLVGTNDVLAYLTMMTARLLELHRVLKSTGSLYLHCDPTASHYLKIMLDAIFGPTNFRNEVVWKRTGAHGAAHRFGPIHDVLLFVTKSDTYTWNQPYVAYEPSYVARFSRSDEGGRLFQDVSLTGPGVRTGDSGLAWKDISPTAIGRHWQPSSTAYDVYEQITGESLAELPMLERLDRFDDAGLIYWPRDGAGTPRFKQYLDVMPGMPAQDVITDIPPINSQAAERLGYPTQKPLALLERLIEASSNEGDIVLDPFCGCGTAVDAAQKMHRRWIGIDITYLSVDLIRKRMRHTYGDEIEETYEIHGIPADIGGAQALFAENPFDFERWAVSLLDGQPNEKQVGDKGIDGVIRFYAEAQKIGRAIVSVKGGATNPNDVSALLGVIQKENAELGIFVTLGNVTKGMQEVADKSGTYESELTGQTYPRIQIVTVADLMAGKRPNLPTAILPYVKAAPRSRDQLGLDL
jgi:DNA modification methylase